MPATMSASACERGNGGANKMPAQMHVPTMPAPARLQEAKQPRPIAARVAAAASTVLQAPLLEEVNGPILEQGELQPTVLPEQEIRH